ncbi:hypothetical protein [Sphingomonas sp. Leaf4]|uniref:hypothetical protein n=1 Tax=Sphingomonas sp. Leaf4 TaxID=2876553 RepID=UPI001E3A23D4|nr:hypothetical protein [Sphingomonas sp. Leaf4]
MPDIRKEAARNVVTNLAPFETSVDIALAQAGRFLATLAEGRLEAQVGPSVGHKAIMSMIATMTALGQARVGMVDTRRELALTRCRLGMREVGIGSLVGCPEEETKAATSGSNVRSLVD